jgi:PAS domain-containing protein
VEAAWRAHLASGQQFQMEQRVRRADGEYRWFFIRRVPLRDESGEVISWYAAAHDIEDQKRAERALRRSETYLAEAQRPSQTGSPRRLGIGARPRQARQYCQSIRIRKRAKGCFIGALTVHWRSQK